jgi:GDP-mannose 6-dehydrogenase
LKIAVIGLGYVRAVIAHGGRKISMLGFGFKPGTDDLRESPLIKLAERLLGRGFDLRIYDGTVSLGSVHGANRAYLVQHVPHISRLLVPTIEEVLAHAETVVIGTPAAEFRDVPRRLGLRQTLVDLVRVSECRSVAGVYEGVCW